MNNLNIKFYICPNCRQHFEPNVDIKHCDKCNVPLMNNDEFLQYKINKNKQKKKDEERFNTILATIFIIAGIAVIWFISSIISSPSPDNTYTCARCGKTFTDSENTKSIVWSNFCVKCHDDVEFMIDVSETLENQ